MASPVPSEAAYILEECEAALRRLVADSAAKGDYERVRQMASLAESISRLARDGCEASASPSRVASPRQSESRAKARKSGRNRGRKAKRSTSARAEYPKFVRTSNQIIKIGWSKREGAEYHHKAPLAVLDLVSSAISEVATRKALFTSDDLIPVIDSEGNEVPTYQIYICIAFMRSEKLVVQHGRQGYSALDPGQLSPEVSDRWKSLPELDL